MFLTTQNNQWSIHQNGPYDRPQKSTFKNIENNNDIKYIINKSKMVRKTLGIVRIMNVFVTHKFKKKSQEK